MKSQMNRLSLFAVASMAVALPAIAFAQTQDTEGVKAASKAFYAALPILDDGTAMAKVWAHTDYVTYVGPRSTSPIVGWEPFKIYWLKMNTIFAKRDPTLSQQQIHVNGNLAWEMGQESGDMKMADGTAVKADFLVTNVYENLDGHWLMVSHHAQPKPQ